MPTEPIFSLRPQDVLKALETTPDGLDTAEAESRLSLYGLNLLSEQQKAPFWEKFIEPLMHPQAGILLLGAILAFIGQDSVLGGVILILTLSNAFFSFWREHRAEQAVEKLQQVLLLYWFFTAV